MGIWLDLVFMLFITEGSLPRRSSLCYKNILRSAYPGTAGVYPLILYNFPAPARLCGSTFFVRMLRRGGAGTPVADRRKARESKAFALQSGSDAAACPPPRAVPA